MKDILDLIMVIQSSRRIDRVLLYGSFARGDIHEGSDVDLIFVGEFPERFHKRTIRILELTDLPVEPLCYTPEEFDQMVAHQNPFIMAALEEGIQLYPK
jgi:predicted nucleotidyltransferase